MKKTLVLYSSRYGHTRRYAEIIARNLKCDILDIRETNLKKVKEYDLIIYGGCVINGMIYDFTKIRFSISELKDKKIIVFADGILPYSESYYEELKNENFDSEDLEIMDFFYVRGGLNKNRLRFGDSLILSYIIDEAVNEPINSKKNKMKRALSRPLDFVKEENIMPVIECAKRKMEED